MINTATSRLWTYVLILGIFVMTSSGPLLSYDLSEIDGDDDHGDSMVLKGWETISPIPYALVENNNPTGISNTDWTTTVNASFQTWEDVIDSYVAFTYETGTGITDGKVRLTSPQSPQTYYSQRLTSGTQPPADAGTLNVIASIDDWEAFGFSSNSLAVTATLFYTTSRYIISADMFVNNDTIPWVIGNSSTAYDLQNVITHEAGHFIGIGHPESDGLTHTTMYFEAGFNETNKRYLSEDDENAVVYLYPENGATLIPPDNNLLGLRDENGDWSDSTSTVVPVPTSDGGGGGGCTVSNGRTHSGGVVFPWLVLIATIGFSWYYSRRQKRALVPVPIKKHDPRQDR